MELEERLAEHPDDDASWLVYGDWLLTRDDPRGALIQLEHRLATARQPAELQNEIDTLVKKHRRSWRGALPASVEVVEWLHGFPSTLAVPLTADAPEVIGRALALREARFVRGLRFVTPSAAVLAPDDEDEEDDEDDDEDDDHDRDDEDDADDEDDIDAPQLARLALGRIVRLELPYLRIGPRGAESLAAVEGIERLRVLDLRYTAISDTGLLALAPRLADIRELYLQRCDIGSDGVTGLCELRALVMLDLRYNSIGALGAQALAKAAFLPHLERLALYRRDVGEASVGVLANSPLPPHLRMIWRAR